jgi:DNA sulfur modification protein DndE
MTGIPIPIVFILMLVAWCHCRAANRISPVPEQEALEIGVEAYIYGYPLVTMEMTRRVMTNVATPLATKAPMGQFASVRDYPDASFKDVPAPNADTLYSIAWVDLSKEAYVLHVPDEAGRYCLMPTLDGWTNVFASPGRRTTGTKAGNHLICGPHWKGVLPRGVAQVQIPYGHGMDHRPYILRRHS